MPLGRLQPLSCATCRRRKVRCNKIDPCSNCVKAGISCVFPEPVRNHRRCASREDVMARLRQLEDTVEYLRHPVTSGASGETCPREESGTEKCPYSHTDPKTVLRGNDGKEEFGRLVVEDGCCRYVSNRLWASLSDQVCSAAVLILRKRIATNGHRLPNCMIFWNHRLTVLMITLIRIRLIQAIKTTTRSYLATTL